MVTRLVDILKVPFSERSEEEQKQIILAGKPRPVLVNLKCKNKFDPACYDKELWLTACDEKCTFYCWSCLLFARETPSVWNTEGFKDYDSLCFGMKKHSCSEDHTKGLIRLMRFIHKNVAPLNPSDEIQDSSAPNKNDDLLEHIVQFLCDLVLQTSDPPEAVNTNFEDSITNGIIDSLNLFKKYDLNSCEKTIDIINSPNTVANFVEILSCMVKTVIKEEIRSSTYVSLIINEQSADAKSAVVSILFRFLKNGDVCERFVGFYCYNKDFVTGVVYQIGEILAEYEIGAKLIAFSVNGAWMTLMQLQSFITLMRQEHGCYFTPCYFQDFEVVLERRISSIVECNIFFKSLDSMRNFTKRSTKIQNAWSAFLKDQGIDLKFDQGNFELIRILNDHRKQFVKFFQSITNNHKEWTADEVLYAMEFQRTLEDFQTIFLLETFFVLSDIIVSLDNTLKSYNPEKVFEERHYVNFQTALCNVKKNSFRIVWDKSCSEKGSDHASESTRFTRFQLVFDVITDCIIGEVKLRFEPLKELQFFHLINPKYREKLELPVNRFFDNISGINELKAEVKRIQVISSYTCDSVYEIIRFLMRNNMKESYKNIYNLAEIILTMPCKPALSDKKRSTAKEENSDSVDTGSTSNEKIFENSRISDDTSKLDNIKKWSTTFSATGKTTKNWSFLSVENELLISLKSREQFFSDFMSLFRKDNPEWCGCELLSQSNQ